MNARGIPTAAYQVLHVLSYPDGVGTWVGGGVSNLGVPPPLWSGPGSGIGTLAGGGGG